jgi:hypothetical protein
MLQSFIRVASSFLLECYHSFILWILGRSVAGVFPRLSPSRGDCQTPSATAAECASVRPLSHSGHSVPLPSAAALGLGIHRWPCSTCQPIIGSWREPIWILQVAHPRICSLLLPSLCPHARSSTEVMLSVPIWTESLGTGISIDFPNTSRCRFPFFAASIRMQKETLRSYFVIKILRRFSVWHVHATVPSCRSHSLGIE